MSEADVISILRAALGIAVEMSLPILMAALVTGIAIGLLQALTSIQEMTLTFVPKIGAIVLVFWISVGSLGRLIIGFYEQQVLSVVSGG